jgi:aconitate hydratase
MGVLPLQFKEETSAESLGWDGSESFDILGIEGGLRPQQEITVRVRRAEGTLQEVNVLCRIDTPIEVEYYRHGGILPYVLRQLLAKANNRQM